MSAEPEKDLKSHQNAFFAILAVKKDEHQALLKVFREYFTVDNHFHDKEARIDLQTCYTKEGGKNVEIVFIDTQGLQGAAAKIGKYLGKYTPQYAILYGTCASDILKVGKVVVCFDAYCYEAGKFNNSGVFERETNKFSTEDRTQLAGLDENVAEKKKCEYGTIISGSAVRSDGKRVIQEERIVDRKIMALEMEASAFFEVCKYYPKTSSLGCVKVVMDNMENKSDAIEGEIPKDVAMRNCAVFIADKVIPKMVHWQEKPTGVSDNTDEIIKSYVSNFLLHVAKFIDRNILDEKIAEKIVLYRFPFSDLDHLRSESKMVTESNGLRVTYRNMGLKIHTLEPIHRDVLIDNEYENNKTYYDIPRCMVNRPMKDIQKEQYEKQWKHLEDAIKNSHSALRNYVTIQNITMEIILQNVKLQRRRSSSTLSNDPKSP